MIDSRKLADLAAQAADDKKANAISLIDVEHVSSITDYFLICSANTGVQIKAIADNIEKKLAEAGHLPLSVEGMQAARWILLDYGVLVVHVMLEQDREFYALEKLWSHGKRVEWTPAPREMQQSV